MWESSDGCLAEWESYVCVLSCSSMPWLLPFIFCMLTSTAVRSRLLEMPAASENQTCPQLLRMCSQSVPFAVEYMGMEAVRIVNRLGDNTAKSGRIAKYVFVLWSMQLLSVTVQRGNAEMYHWSGLVISKVCTCLAGQILRVGAPGVKARCR